ncbi:MAG: class I SAM-dependent methyltransferase [Omnitrophica WOR_2 bacterium]
MYTLEPKDPKTYTANFDAIYSRLSGIYDFVVRHTPFYNTWVAPAIPLIRGPRVLEISFGTGWLITHYANRFETYGIDLNQKMIQITTRNLKAAGITIPLQRANIEAIPYRSEVFDTVVNTMAFSGYPRADRAMSEIRRVLKPGGRLILIDAGWPEDRNWMGSIFTRLVEATGDILRDMGLIFTQHGFEYRQEVVGLFGSLYLYIAEKL